MSLAWACTCLAIFLSAQAQEEGVCSADGIGCITIPEFPECEYSCDEMLFIGPDCGNRDQIWPPCPHGDDGCRDCKNRNNDCQKFADAYDGYGCEDNPSFMIDLCATSCNTCHLRNLTTRCAGVAAEPESLKPGDINATFQRILSISGLEAEVVSRDPWIVRFPNFLSDEEVNHFLTNRDSTWSRASDTGAKDEFGRSTKLFSGHRSTGVIWCNNTCHSHPIAQRVRARVGEITRVHPHYFESFQFLKYVKGEYYRTHHDAAGLRKDSVDSYAGHRIYTFFLYLNEVDAGGETHFPRIGLKVPPSRGSAILWPSVKNENPYEIDDRTEHEALIVNEGEKYSANIWVHNKPYTLAHNIGCSASPID